MLALPKSLEEESVGNLVIPPNLANQPNTTWSISLVTNQPGNSAEQGIESAIVNITLVDGEGQSITELDSLLTICLSRPNQTKKGKRVCLGYYEEMSSKWKCQDECLTTGGGANLLCGQTDHLTNFALLLSGAGGQNEPCQSFSRNNTLPWVSLGMVAGAVVIVLLFSVIIEINIRWRKYKQDRLKCKSFTFLEWKALMYTHTALIIEIEAETSHI